MEVPHTITTYNVTKHLLNHLPSALKLGNVINPVSERDEEKSEEDIFSSFYDEGYEYVSDTYTKKDFLKLKETDTVLPSNSDELLELCEESKYGDLKTQETVLNHEVRKSYEIPGDRLELTEDCLEFLESIKTSVSNDLYEGKNISFKLNKLNVYTKGCHFSTHVDTPKDNMVGTLVVECPSKYTGGEFIFNSSRRYTKDKWFAFYSDIPHSVNKVKSGCRVTITFYIQKEEDTIDNYNLYISPEVEEMGNLILTKLDNMSRIGLLLSHKYSYSEFENGVYKGSDGTLIKYLEDKCNISDVIPVIVHHDETFGYDEWSNNSSSETVYRFREEDINVAIDKMNGKIVDYEPTEYSFIDFISLGSPYMTLDYKHDDYIEYTGNEAQEGYVNGKYFNLAVILT